MQKTHPYAHAPVYPLTSHLLYYYTHTQWEPTQSHQNTPTIAYPKIWPKPHPTLYEQITVWL